MVELELEINQKAGEWGLLQELSSHLQPAHGPGLTGLVNLGNSCYLNSIMQVNLAYSKKVATKNLTHLTFQVIFKIPSFIEHFVNRAPQIFATFPADPVNDINIQT